VKDPARFAFPRLRRTASVSGVRSSPHLAFLVERKSSTGRAARVLHGSAHFIFPRGTIRGKIEKGSQAWTRQGVNYQLRGSQTVQLRSQGSVLLQLEAGESAPRESEIVSVNGQQTQLDLTSWSKLWNSVQPEVDAQRSMSVMTSYSSYGPREA